MKEQIKIIPVGKSKWPVYINHQLDYYEGRGFLIPKYVIDCIQEKKWNGSNDWFTLDNFYSQIGFFVFWLGIICLIISFI